MTGGIKADDKEHCDNSGRCLAPPGASGITNCIHCGKELVERDGKWFTWDADMHPIAAVQHS